MSLIKSTAVRLALFASISISATESQADPVAVSHTDLAGHCDTLSIPEFAFEVGQIGIFPAPHSLESGFVDPDGPSVCTSPTGSGDDPSQPNPVVSIRNATGQDFSEVWYVADLETTISNFDGFAEDSALGVIQNFAFRIDNDVSDPLGAHHPLLVEDLVFDGIWQAGETWTFVLQDFDNTLGIGPQAINSIGIGSLSSGLISPPPAIPSSGSIIAIAVPEPSAAGLATLSALASVVIRRRKS